MWLKICGIFSNFQCLIFFSKQVNQTTLTSLQNQITLTFLHQQLQQPQLDEQRQQRVHRPPQLVKQLVHRSPTSLHQFIKDIKFHPQLNHRTASKMKFSANARHIVVQHVKLSVNKQKLQLLAPQSVLPGVSVTKGLLERTASASELQTVHVPLNPSKLTFHQEVET